MTTKAEALGVRSKERSRSEPRASMTKIRYNDWVVRWFIWASVVWGLVAVTLGALIALQLAFWPANVTEYFSFGRMRPLHTNAAIFAFVGNMMFAGVYHSTQRLVKARLPSDGLAKAHFWGWQAIILAAALTLPLGLTQGKEYAELEWPIDIAVAVVWVIFAINFFWTLANRREKHLYVAIWFYIATIATVAVLHIVNSMAIPVFALKSYSIFGGAQDALIQWWYGHNAVAFFLTTPILGIMYYYLPKAARRPVYSYRLSVIHFWALVFIYIWAGPHHLLNTALPEWAQTLGMVFSLMLWAPSWGGMLNGLLTLRGAWDRVRKDPVLKFLAAGVTFYGMATFEGPMLSIRSVSGLAHYTDWIIGHVHSGALGWNGFMAAGMFYFLVPRLYGTKLHSEKLADQHFYIGTAGIILYMVSMWVSGVTQGLMWKALNADGSLMYPNFVTTVQSINWLYWMRLIGGLMYLVGMVMMAVNLYRTAKSGAPVDVEVEVPTLEEEAEPVPWGKLVFGRPVVLVAIVTVLFALYASSDAISGIGFFAVAVSVAGLSLLVLTLGQGKDDKPAWQRLVEGRAMVFTVVTVLAVLVGGIAEIVPALVMQPAQPSATQPYRALELEGRDIYIREGCYVCHSQMIRPFKSEEIRYGEASTVADSQYDHPFQWGSKRTGPDLARQGGRNPNVWHYKHFVDPRAVTEGSIMPAYPHFATNTVDYSRTADKLRAMRSIGVPYTPEQIANAEKDARAQAEGIVADLKEQEVDASPTSEMVAILAFMQRLGLNPEPAEAPAEAPAEPVSLRSEGGAP